MTRFLPLLIFALLALFLFAGLSLNARLVPSPLVGKPLPDFSLPLLHAPSRLWSPQAMRGAPWLLNVWASWCVGCRAEHPYLLRLAGEGAVIIGYNYKDESAAAKQWLRDFENPYRHSVTDAGGGPALDLGVYGVPETFVVDAAGVLRYKHVGPLSESDLAEVIRPLLVKLRGEAR